MLAEVLPADVSVVTRAIAVALVVVCAGFDWRSRRIPNYLTVPALGAGLLIYALAEGWAGLAFSAKGLALGAGLFFVPYFLGGMGAGDVKLMGGVGALLGWQVTLVALLYTALAGGIMAAAVMLRRRAVGRTFARMGSMFQLLFASMRMPSADSLEGKGLTIPYALPIAVGTAAALIVKWPL